MYWWAFYICRNLFKILTVFKENFDSLKRKIKKFFATQFGDPRWKKNTFFAQKSVTFEPFLWCGWALLMKCSLLNRLSSWLRLDFGRRQLCCWGCLKGICTWISRYFPPRKWYKISLFCSIGYGDPIWHVLRSWKTGDSLVAQ
jgi:hypothetical protein